jgi:hypothetical protein
MSAYKLPDKEEMDILQGWIMDSLRDFFYLETLIMYGSHPHGIWHNLDNLIKDLHDATEKAEKLMKELGYEHE